MAPRPYIPIELKQRPFRLDEALAVGISRRALQGKSWERIGRGLYRWAKAPLDPWRLLVAWRSLLPPDAAFAGLTAAWLYRLDVDPCHPVEVIGHGIRSRPGLIVHDWEREVVLVRGLRATTLQCTFRDLKRRLPEVELLVLADQALRLNLGRFHALAEPAESPMETRLRWCIIRAGLPTPQVQTRLHDAAGRFVGRADLFYPQSRLVIEYDGANHRDRLVEDNKRQNLLVSAGYRLLRFTSADQPELITAQVKKQLRV